MAFSGAGRHDEVCTLRRFEMHDNSAYQGAAAFLVEKEICMTTIVVNGITREVQAPTDTPLLYVLA